MAGRTQTLALKQTKSKTSKKSLSGKIASETEQIRGADYPVRRLRKEKKAQRVLSFPLRAFLFRFFYKERSRNNKN